MAVSRNSSRYTFGVSTTVTPDNTNRRYKVVSTPYLTVKVYKFSSSTAYTLTVNNGSSASSTIQGTYGDNSTNKTYYFNAATAYYSYSASVRAVGISASSGDISSGGYGPGKLTYSGSISLAAKYSSAGTLNATADTQAQVTATLSELPASVGYTRTILWYSGTTLIGTTTVAGSNAATSYDYVFAGLYPNTIHTIKAVVKAGGSDGTTIAEKTVNITTPQETGTLAVTANTTFVTVAVTGMFNLPSYARTVELYYKKSSDSVYVLHSTVTVSGTSADFTVTGLISNAEYDFKVLIKNGTMVLETLTSMNVETLTDESLIPTAHISGITQELGTRKCTIVWVTDKSIAGTTYTILAKATGESTWTTLDTLTDIESPLEVTAHDGNKTFKFKITSENDDVVSGTINDSNEYDFYVRDDFLWDSEKTQGGTLSITANEWNRLRDYAIAKNPNAVIPAVKQGDPITAVVYNTMKNAIDEVVTIDVDDKHSGDAITAADIEALKTAINTTVA